VPYKRTIVTEGHAALRRPAKRVTPQELAEPLFQQLIDDMFLTMYEAPGVGLAAPQVGISKQLFVADVKDEEHQPVAVINPKIVAAEDEIELTEGCLSVPGYVGEITRFSRVAVSGLDRNGHKIRLEGDGLFAQCLQHEIDHLHGKLYKDSARNIRLSTPADEREDPESAQEA
jgi:peptide deformylase